MISVDTWLLCPALQAERSNKRHRPIGIGVQGLADAFILMRYPFESPEAQLLNIQIFETIYYAALEASCELAAELGPYETYAGSPVSKGVSSFQCLKSNLGHGVSVQAQILTHFSFQILQYDMWSKTPTDLWDWKALKEKIAKYVFLIYSSLYICLMSYIICIEIVFHP